MLNLYMPEVGAVLYETTPFAREIEMHMKAVCVHACVCMCLHAMFWRVKHEKKDIYCSF